MHFSWVVLVGFHWPDKVYYPNLYRGQPGARTYRTSLARISTEMLDVLQYNWAVVGMAEDPKFNKSLALPELGSAKDFF